MKLLIGGSPCTHWSIAQTKHRETEPAGLGWELFKNYLIAREKFKPDFFLYENNKSMSKAIREQITKELGVEPILINSALVSAQNRQRLYWVGKRNPDGTYSKVSVQQPKDRGIMLRDVLDGVVGTQDAGEETAKAHDERRTGALTTAQNDGDIIEPVRVANINKGGQGDRIYTAEKKSCAIKSQSGGAGGHGQGLYAISVNTMRDATTKQDDSDTKPIRVGTIENNAKNQEYDSQQYRVYSPDGKSVTLCGAGGGWEPRRDCMQPQSTCDAGARSDQTGICGHPPRILCRPVPAEQQNKEGQINE